MAARVVCASLSGEQPALLVGGGVVPHTSAAFPASLLCADRPGGMRQCDAPAWPPRRRPSRPLSSALRALPPPPPSTPPPALGQGGWRCPFVPLPRPHPPPPPPRRGADVFRRRGIGGGVGGELASRTRRAPVAAACRRGTSAPFHLGGFPRRRVPPCDASASPCVLDVRGASAVPASDLPGEPPRTASVGPGEEGPEGGVAERHQRSRRAG